MITRQARLEALSRQVERLERQKQRIGYSNQRFSTIELMIFLGGTVLVILTLIPARWLGLLVLLLGFIIFAVITYYHGKSLKSYVNYTVFLNFKLMQLARMRLDWDALPAQLESEESDHPFEIDLDITGERSLHRLVNTAVSFEGGQRLSAWLLHPDSDGGAIRRRQLFVQELLTQTGFRAKLLLSSLHATRYTENQYDESGLLEWLNDEEEIAVPRSILYVPTLACATTILLIALYFLNLAPPWAFLLPVVFSAAWFLATRERYNEVGKDAAQLRTVFEQLNGILSFLESYPYRRDSQLKKLCEPFFSGRRPSEFLPKLARVARRTSFSQNPEIQFFLNALLPLDAYNAYQLSQYKMQIRSQLPKWLDAWFELEALCSLANFAYLNPAYAFPRLLTTTGEQPVFVAQALGHPLIAEEQKVVNDFALTEKNEIILITGSNMAGKSTFLRTLGINLCLAYAGAPVNATSLRVSLFEIYACIKISDSLADGYSYFYAEVRRLQGLLKRLQEQPSTPVFLLIDEIFKGTNNEERLIGSSAYIHALAGQNCVGAISTHDLELVRLAAELPTLKNYHFREEVQNGQMVFDYQLHSGPCPTRNALKIMQLAGLPISWEGQNSATISTP
jgi:ABC-type multidrug transport system fused ATPase/permease subunit